MANVDLNTPVLTGGIVNTNFFNGRVLAAEDLTALQKASAQQRRQLAHGLGDGVVYGLEVTSTGASPMQPILHITAGLALNRNGDAVALSSDVDLAIVKSSDVQAATNGLFAPCQPVQGILPTNLDCYVLTASPVSSLQGSAPMTDMLDSGFASKCASANAVEGLQFSLLPLGVANTTDTTTLSGLALQLYSTLAPQFLQLAGLTGTAAGLQTQIAPNLSKFRNVMAHLCFGTEALASFPANPFSVIKGESAFIEYGILHTLRDQGYLTDCAVPLALVYWTAAGVEFADMWSVRRPVFPFSASEMWPVFSGRRRGAEGLAMLLQFQNHISELLGTLGTASLTSVSADNYFRYLPPVGLLPLLDAQPNSGFNYTTFFANITHRCGQPSDGLCAPYFIEGGKVVPLLHKALLYPPIDLNRQEMVWLYWVRENMEPPSSTGTQPYLIFTNGHVPNEGLAQFDLNYWNYANFV